MSGQPLQTRSCNNTFLFFNSYPIEVELPFVHNVVVLFCRHVISFSWHQLFHNSNCVVAEIQPAKAWNSLALYPSMKDSSIKISQLSSKQLLLTPAATSKHAAGTSWCISSQNINGTQACFSKNVLK
eukprot:scaffold13199_cov62-Attheya_sp.AAC.7